MENFWDFSTRDDVTFTMSSLARQAPAVAARPRLFRRTSRPAAVVRAAPAADAEQTREFAVEGEAATPEILVVGLGPGNAAQITVEAWEAIVEPGARVFVRTARHPTLEGLPPHVSLTTFDHVYEATKRLEDVYPAIAAELLDVAKIAAATAAATADEPDGEPDTGDGVDDGEDDGGGDGEDDDIFASFALEDDSDVVTSHRTPRSRRIVYAVPGDPCVAENSVAILRERAAAAGVKVTTLPGVSFLEPTLAAIGVDVMPSLAIVDAIDVARSAHAVGVVCDSPTLLCQLHSNAVASDAKLTLMAQFPEDHPCVLVHAAGTEAEVVERVPLHEMDRSEHVGILSSAYLPAVTFESLNDVDDDPTPGAGGFGGASVEALLDAVGRVRGLDVDSEPAPPSYVMGEGDAIGDDGDGWDEEARFADGAADDFEGEGSPTRVPDDVWLAADHADPTAIEALRAAANEAVRRAEDDADPEDRARAMGRLLAHVCLHVSMASEAGEYAMRDVVRHAVEAVREV